MTDTHTVLEPDAGFQAGCHLCDWESKLWVGPDAAQGERIEHVSEAHPDAAIDWHADAPAVEIVDTEGEDE